MNIIKIYFLANIKQSILLTIFSIFALALTISMLVMAIASPAIIDDVFFVASKQFSGDVDLILSTYPDSDTRFFSLSELRDDNRIQENSTEIHGFFRTFASIQFGETHANFVRLIAGDFNTQQAFNPIISDFFPQVIHASHIIVSEDWATRNRANIGDRVSIVFGGRTTVFEIATIAKSEGIFAGGDTVFIPSIALNRVIPAMGSTIVTHAFIRTVNSKATTAIKDVIYSDYNYRHLLVQTIEGNFLNSDQANSMRVHTVLLSMISALSALVALFVLMRLKFSTARHDFVLLKNLGLRKSQAVAITLLMAVFLSLLSSILAVGISYAVVALLGNAHFFASGISVSGLALGLALGGGFVLSMLASLVGIKSEKAVTEKSKFLLWRYKEVIVFWISLVVALVFISIIQSVSYLLLIVLFIFLIGLIYSIPKIIEYGFLVLSKIKQNIYTLRFNQIAGSNGFSRLLSFIMVAMLVVAISSTIIEASTILVEDMNYPFDIVVTELTSVNNTLVNQLLELDGIDNILRASVLLNTPISVSNAIFNTTVIGLEDDGLRFFGSSVLEDNGIIIGNRLARNRYLSLGQSLSFTHGTIEHQKEIIGIVDSDYFGGSFILVNLCLLANDVRPFNELLIIGKSEVEVDNLLFEVSNIVGTGGATVRAENIDGLAVGDFVGIVEIVQAFCIVIIVLVALVAMLLMLLQAKLLTQKAEKLEPLGLRFSVDIKHLVICISIIVLSLFLILPFIMLLFSLSSRAIFISVGIRAQIIFFTSTIWLSAFFSVVFIVLAFVVIYIIIKKLPKNNG